MSALVTFVQEIGQQSNQKVSWAMLCYHPVSCVTRVKECVVPPHPQEILISANAKYD